MKRKLFFCFVLFFSSIVSYSNVYFEQIKSEELSNKTVFDIAQDSLGYIWFATNDGLFQYDGYTLNSYRYNQADSNSISSNYIRTLYVDSKGRLWIGAFGGLNLFVPQKDYFIRFVQDDLNDKLISNNDILLIYEDSENRLWVGTENGLNLFDAENGGFTTYYYPEEDFTDKNNKAITSIIDVNSDFLLIGSYFRGLYIFDKKNKKFIKPNIPNLLSINNSDRLNVWCIKKDLQGNYWIGTYNQGLYLLNADFQIIQKYHLFAEEKQHRIPNNIVFDLETDRFGRIWVTTDNGLSIIDKEKNTITNYKTESKMAGSLTMSSIRSIYKDRIGNLWMGGWASGVAKIDWNKQRFIKFFFDNRLLPEKLNINCLLQLPDETWLFGTDNGLYIYKRKSDELNRGGIVKDMASYHLENEVILSLLHDRRGFTWIGAKDKLIKYKDNIQSRKIYAANIANEDSLANAFISQMYEDDYGRIWFATQIGLHQYDYKSDRFIRFKTDGINAVNHKFTTAIEGNNAGGLWIGTFKGLNYLNTATGEFKSFIHQPDDQNSISNGKVNDIHLDSRGFLWVATADGISVMDNLTKKFINHNSSDEIAGNIINGILEDSNGNIWLSSDGGVWKINFSHFSRSESFDEDVLFKNITHYDRLDGLLDEAFKAKSIFIDKNGYFYFGGINGVTSFHPDSIIANKDVPPVLITNFKIGNKQVKIGAADSPLDKHITYTNQIVLNYKQSVISFEYVALNYTNPEKNSYAYMMEGFDEEWNYVDNQRSATYTNLDAGTYIFKVIASNNDGVWNVQGSTLTVKIMPAPWETWQAFVLYAILLLIAIASFARIINANHRIENELRLKAVESQKAKEMSQFKNNFFTNISHEFRTPLTLVLGPIEKLMDDHYENEEASKQLKLVKRNAQRMLRLINQLLDISKIEAGHMKLKVSEGDIVECVRGIFEAFSIKASQENIQYRFYSSHTHIVGLFDQDKVEKILYNILANAFKFTPKNGEIDVLLHLKYSPDQMRIVEMVVHDSGLGIAKDEVEKIFERFYNLDKVTSHGIKGTGIGLSLAAQLTKINYGTITVDSENGKGSRFTVVLPIEKEIFQEDEIDNLNIARDDVNHNFAIEEPEEAQLVNIEEDNRDNRPIVLIVEDNRDVREFVKDNLDDEYYVLKADNGEKGVEIALKHIPDIIVTDIMMPIMDGYELCTRLKQNLKTSHIPIIMLTARASEEHQLEGINTGADSYMPKPFEIKMLKAQIKNLLENRKKIRKKYSNDFILEPSDVDYNSMDEEFLKKTIELIELNISDPDLSIEKLSADLNMSRSQMYRKVKALTDLSPVEFVRIIKIKRAAQLIRKRSHNISEIAYMVGFSDINYFRRCFKQIFGMTPSKYISTKEELS